MKDFFKRNKKKIVIAGLGVAVGLPIVLLNLAKGNAVSSEMSVSEIIPDTTDPIPGALVEEIDEGIFTELAPTIKDCVLSKKNHIIEQNYYVNEALTKRVKVLVIVEND